jgi:hypothetical protein
VLEAPPTVQYYWPAPGESVPAGCSELVDDNSAFYCSETDTLVVSQDLALRIWNGQYARTPGLEREAAGDFGVAYVLAHEYAHNVQAELGLGRGLPVINTELHADCWAGVWGNAKFYSGQLEAGDVEEAVSTAARVGDYDWTNPTFHGTPEQRATAFMYGYNSGSPAACEAVLNQTY